MGERSRPIAPTAGADPLHVDEGTNIRSAGPRTAIDHLDLHGFLYRIPGQGGQAVRITNIFADAARPRFSPNGQRVAFQSYDHDNGGYFISRW